MRLDFQTWHWKRAILIGAAVALVMGGSRAAQSQDQKKSGAMGGSSATGDVASGKAIFMKDGCYHCHGFSAAGTGTAPSLIASVLPVEAFIAYIRHPARQMPPFTEKVIADKDLTDIFAFVHSQPKPPDPKSIPMLNQ